MPAKTKVTDTSKRRPGARKVNRTGRRRTKSGIMLDLLKRPKGASIGQLRQATGWQPHSVRAALTGFRKRGCEIERGVESGVSRYRIVDKRKAAGS